MSNEIIKNLLDALSVSPDNIPLRLQVATMMMQEKMYADAASQYLEILSRSYGNNKAQLGLASSYLNSSNRSYPKTKRFCLLNA